MDVPNDVQQHHVDLANDNVIMDFTNDNVAPHQRQSILIKEREKTALELYNEKTKSQLRLVGSQIVGHFVEPLKRNKITNKADIWNVKGFTFTKYSKTLEQIVICETCVIDGKFASAEIDYGASRSTSNVVQHEIASF